MTNFLSFIDVIRFSICVGFKSRALSNRRFVFYLDDKTFGLEGNVTPASPSRDSAAGSASAAACDKFLIVLHPTHV